MHFLNFKLWIHWSLKGKVGVVFTWLGFTALFWFVDTSTAPLSADSVPTEKGQMLDAHFIKRLGDFHLVIKLWYSLTFCCLLYLMQIKAWLLCFLLDRSVW